jgi:multidrug efflux pump subunit AcrB
VVDAVVNASRIRLRPILMTTLTTILGVLPIALGLGAGADSRKPLGLAVVGGLLFSMVLTLVIVPVVYTMLARFQHERTLSPAEVEPLAGAGAPAVGHARPR